MRLFRIFLKTDLELDPLARHLRSILNVSTKNQRPWHRDQRRYGLNIGGGFYYLFEVFGLVLTLIKNEGEVMEEYGWEYYISCKEMEDIDGELFAQCILYLGHILHKKGITNKVVED